MFALGLVMGGPLMVVITLLCSFALVAGMARVSTGYVGDPEARTYQAAAASMTRGFFVVQGVDDYHVAIAGAGQLCLGVILESTINVNDTIAIAIGGESVAVIGAAVEAGQLLCTDSQGRVIPLVPGAYPCAIALSSNSNANDEVTVKVLKSAPGNTQEQVTYITASGAIPAVPGTYVLNGAAALAMTLIAPPSDGIVIDVIAETAHAHTVTAPANGIQTAGATDDTVTYSAAGQYITLKSAFGKWVVKGLSGATLSEV